MAISLRLTKNEEELFKKYAEMNNITVSELIRNTVIAKIHDDIDLETYSKAVELYNKEKKTLSLEALEKEI